MARVVCHDGRSPPQAYARARRPGLYRLAPLSRALLITRRRDGPQFQGPAADACMDEWENLPVRQVVDSLAVRPPSVLVSAKAALAQHRRTSDQGSDKGDDHIPPWPQPGDGTTQARRRLAEGHAVGSRLTTSSTTDMVSSSVELPPSLPSVAALSPLGHVDRSIHQVGGARASFGFLKSAFVYPFNLEMKTLSQSIDHGGASPSLIPTGAQPLEAAVLAAIHAANPDQFEAPRDPVMQFDIASPEVPELTRVPGRRGDDAGFGPVSDAGRLAAANLIAARRRVACAAIGPKTFQLTPRSAAELQIDIVRAIPLAALFPPTGSPWAARSSEVDASEVREAIARSALPVRVRLHQQVKQESLGLSGSSAADTTSAAFSSDPHWAFVSPPNPSIEAAATDLVDTTSSSPEALRAIRVLQSARMTRVVGLAAHLCFQRILLPEALPSMISPDHEESVGKLEAFLVRAWQGVEDALNDDAADRATLRALLLLALKAMVECAITAQFPDWMAFERSVMTFHARFGLPRGGYRGPHWPNELRVPRIVPLEAQIDDLLSCLLDAGQIGSTLPQALTTHEALGKLQQSRCHPPPATHHSSDAVHPTPVSISSPAAPATDAALSPRASSPASHHSFSPRLGTPLQREASADLRPRGSRRTPAVLRSVGSLTPIRNPRQLLGVRSHLVEAGFVVKPNKSSDGKLPPQSSADAKVAAARRLLRRYHDRAKVSSRFNDRVELLSEVVEHATTRAHDVLPRAVADELADSRAHRKVARVAFMQRAQEAIIASQDLLTISSAPVDSFHDTVNNATFNGTRERTVVDVLRQSDMLQRRHERASSSSSPPTAPVPLWASPLRRVSDLIGDDWAEEHEVVLEAIYTRARGIVDPWAADLVPADAAPVHPPTDNHQPGHDAAAQVLLQPRGESGLPLTAAGITALIAGRATSFPSPFAAEQVDAFGPTRWTQGPAATAAARDLATAQEAARVREARHRLRARILEHTVHRELESVRARAFGPASADDSALVRYVRAVGVVSQAKAPARPAVSQTPVMTAAKPDLVGVPTRWSVGVVARA